MPRNFIDADTQEYIEGVTSYRTQKQENSIIAYKIKMTKAKKLNRIIAQHCGGFFFYRYDDLLDVVKGNTATAFRFLYLCACADQDGCFIKYGKEKCLTRDDFTYIFDVPLRSTRRYVDELTKCNLLYKDEKEYKLNPMYYYCSLQNDENRRRSVRTFRNCIKELYNNSDPNEHRYMGEILKFIPYINLYNNVLCWYPEESDKEKIQPLTIQEIRYILRNNSTYGYEIEKKLESLFIKGEPVFGKFEAAEEYQYIINPRLLYRGNDAKQLQSLIDQFDIAKGQYLNKKKLSKEKISND